MYRRLFLAIPAILLLLAISVASNTPRTAAAAGPISSPPGKYYLSLGDSLAFGFQQAKANAELSANKFIDASTFNTGYTDVFGRMLNAIDPGIQVVNYGCPGESTVTFMTACPFPFPAHNPYSGSQMSAALSFLAAHPGQVSPITIDLGANDFLGLLSSCKGDFTCVAQGFPGLLKTIGANYGQILGALRQAAPTAEIIVSDYYDPYAAANPAADTLVKAGNGVLQQLAAATGAFVADPFRPINLSTPQPQTICSLLNVCGPLQDIHPNDWGYLVMAKAFWDGSGYASLAHGFMDAWYGPASGSGFVLFGTGAACTGLVGTATRDLQPAGTTHVVYVTGNDLGGTSGDNGIIPGTTYNYENLTLTASGAVTDNNNGSCYSVKAAGS